MVEEPDSLACEIRRMSVIRYILGDEPELVENIKGVNEQNQTTKAYILCCCEPRSTMYSYRDRQRNGGNEHGFNKQPRNDASDLCESLFLIFSHPDLH